MFWSKSKKKTDKQGKPSKDKNKGLPASGNNGVVGTKGQRPDSAKLREEALANARKAREQIGEETLNKIAAAMHKKQQSKTEQAKAKINQASSDRVSEEIRILLDDR